MFSWQLFPIRKKNTNHSNPSGEMCIRFFPEFLDKPAYSAFTGSISFQEFRICNI